MNATEHFESIVNEHYEALYRFALSLTRSESDGRDLTQQTFYIWAAKGHQLRDIKKVKTWLYTTLHRIYLAGRRHQVRFPHLDYEEASDQLPNVSPIHGDRMDFPQALSALTQVDKIFQPAVALFYLEDCSYKDIAEILEVPIGTVKSRIARGIAQLQAILLPEATDATVSERDGARRDLSPTPVQEPITDLSILQPALPMFGNGAK